MKDQKKLNKGKAKDEDNKQVQQNINPSASSKKRLKSADKNKQKSPKSDAKNQSSLYNQNEGIIKINSNYSNDNLKEQLKLIEYQITAQIET